MRIAFDLHDDVVDDSVNCIEMWDQGSENVGKGWGHGGAHYQERLGDDGECALPEVGHVSSVTASSQIIDHRCN